MSVYALSMHQVKADQRILFKSKCSQTKLYNTISFVQLIQYFNLLHTAKSSIMHNDDQKSEPNCSH